MKTLKFKNTETGHRVTVSIDPSDCSKLDDTAIDDLVAYIGLGLRYLKIAQYRASVGVEFSEGCISKMNAIDVTDKDDVEAEPLSACQGDEIGTEGEPVLFGAEGDLVADLRGGGDAGDGSDSFVYGPEALGQLLVALGQAVEDGPIGDLLGPNRAGTGGLGFDDLGDGGVPLPEQAPVPIESELDVQDGCRCQYCATDGDEDL